MTALALTFGGAQPPPPPGTRRGSHRTRVTRDTRDGDYSMNYGVSKPGGFAPGSGREAAGGREGRRKAGEPTSTGPATQGLSRLSAHALGHGGVRVDSRPSRLSTRTWSAPGLRQQRARGRGAAAPGGGGAPAPPAKRPRVFGRFRPSFREFSAAGLPSPGAARRRPAAGGHLPLPPAGPEAEPDPPLVGHAGEGAGDDLAALVLLGL